MDEVRRVWASIENAQPASRLVFCEAFGNGFLTDSCRRFGAYTW